MDAFEGHLQHCLRQNWGSIYRPFYEARPPVRVPVPVLGYPVPSGAFFVDIALRDSDEPELPQRVVDLQVFRGKRSLETDSWEANLASQRVAAIRKWTGVLLTNLPCFTLGRQLTKDGPLGPSLGDSLKHIFSNKATGTLHNRVGPVLRFISWCKQNSVCSFPIREEIVYRFMFEQSGSASPTFLRSFLVSISFSWHVLGLSGALDVVESQRVIGLARHDFLRKRKTRPRDPLTVNMVRALEDFLFESRAIARDRSAAGCFLLCVYMRARCSDMLFLEDLIVDEVNIDGIPEGYIEGSVTRSKTSYTAERKTRLLPMAAPRIGVTGRDWFHEWKSACVESGKPSGQGVPLLPAPSPNGWNKVPLRASEAGDWLRKILTACGIDRSLLTNVGTHSLKATCLTWCAKFGIGQDVRRHLGYHVESGDRTMLLYSRDTAAHPLRELERVIRAIRTEQFYPDMTRSGYFRRQNPNLGPDQPDEAEPLSIDSSSSSSEDSQDEEDRELDADAEEQAQEIVLDPWSEFPLMQGRADRRLEAFRNKQTRYVHLIADDAGTKFHCGRQVGESYFKLEPLPKFFTPQCKQCFRHVAISS